MNRPRFWKACHLTIQKLLYVYVIIAAGSRGLYYTTEVYELCWHCHTVMSFNYKLALTNEQINYILIIVFLAIFLIYFTNSDSRSLYQNNGGLICLQCIIPL